MTGSAWIAFAGLFFAVVVQTVGLAFWLGGMSARMRSLEGRPSGDDCASQLAAMNATLLAMDKNNDRRFGDLEHTVRNLLQTKAPARRRASE